MGISKSLIGILRRVVVNVAMWNSGQWVPKANLLQLSRYSRFRDKLSKFTTSCLQCKCGRVMKRG